MNNIHIFLISSFRLENKHPTTAGFFRGRRILNPFHFRCAGYNSLFLSPTPISLQPPHPLLSFSLHRQCSIPLDPQSLSLPLCQKMVRSRAGISIGTGKLERAAVSSSESTLAECGSQICHDSGGSQICQLVGEHPRQHNRKSQNTAPSLIFLEQLHHVFSSLSLLFLDLRQTQRAPFILRRQFATHSRISLVLLQSKTKNCCVPCAFGNQIREMKDDFV